MVGNVELLHQVDESGQLQSARVELKLSLQVFHIILRQHCHHSFHVPLVVLLSFEERRMAVEILNRIFNAAHISAEHNSMIIEYYSSRIIVKIDSMRKNKGHQKVESSPTTQRVINADQALIDFSREL